MRHPSYLLLGRRTLLGYSNSSDQWCLTGELPPFCMSNECIAASDLSTCRGRVWFCLTSDVCLRDPSRRAPADMPRKDSATLARYQSHASRYVVLYQVEELGLDIWDLDLMQSWTQCLVASSTSFKVDISILCLLDHFRLTSVY